MGQHSGEFCMLLLQSYASSSSADSWCWRRGWAFRKHSMLILMFSRGAILRECAFRYTALKVACTGMGTCHLGVREVYKHKGVFLQQYNCIERTMVRAWLYSVFKLPAIDSFFCWKSRFRQTAIASASNNLTRKCNMDCVTNNSFHRSLSPHASVPALACQLNHLCSFGR